MWNTALGICIYFDELFADNLDFVPRFNVKTYGAKQASYGCDFYISVDNCSLTVYKTSLFSEVGQAYATDREKRNDP